MTDPATSRQQPSEAFTVCNCRFAWHARGIRGCAHRQPQPAVPATNNPQVPRNGEPR